MANTLTTDLGIKPGLGAGGGKPGPRGGDPRRPGPEGPKDWPAGWAREDELEAQKERVGGAGGWASEDALEPQKYRIGMWVALASILMLFIALTSAYIVRGVPALGGGTDDWLPIDMPRVLWINTVILLASSVTLGVARRSLKRDDYSRFKNWISLTTVLGIAFLGGQVMAWRELSSQGVYINSHPHSSFFYLLTSLHGLHLLGGVIALAYVTVAALRMRI